VRLFVQRNKPLYGTVNVDCLSVSLVGVKLSPLGTSATNWPIVPVPDDTDDERGAVGGMRIGRGNRSTLRKHAPLPHCPPQFPHDVNWARNPAAAVGSRRLTAYLWHCRQLMWLYYI
jgi:hypothetical protein